ncbi:MAG: T9SS type A sorting domain-containing protein [bacterium]|nr:T9SS type A sorting domain-containing protein [bacterium]
MEHLEHPAQAVMLLFIILTGTNLFASAPDTLWTRTYGWPGDDGSESVCETFDNGFIIAGWIFGTESQDVYLIRTNSLGDTLWTKTFGGASTDGGNSVQQTSDSGFIIAGNTSSFGIGVPTYPNVYLIRTNSSGDTMWTRTFGGVEYDVSSSVQQTKDGGFIIIGSTNSFGIGTRNCYLIKTNSNGDAMWTKTYGGTGWDEGQSVQQTSDSGFIITGGAGSFGAGSYDVYLIKTNSSGDTLWTRTFGGTDFDYGGSVQQISDGGFIIAGVIYSFGADSGDVYLIRTNSSGDTLWTKTYGGAGEDYGFSVQQTKDNGFIIAGVTNSFGAGGYDIYLVRTNSSGDTLWTKTIGGTYDDWGWHVQQIEDGGFIVVGVTRSFGAGNNDIYLIRLDKEVGVEEKSNIETPSTTLRASQNPFSKSTVISYQIPATSKVSLALYDITGSCVKTLIDEQKPAGTYSTTLNAKELKTGVYFVKLTAGNFSTTKKLILMK